MTTSARSPMPGVPGEDNGREQGNEERGEAPEAQCPAGLIQLRAERELHDLGPCRERDGDEAIVAAQHLGRPAVGRGLPRSEEHTSELQSHVNLVCRLLLEKKKKILFSLHVANKKKKTQ